MNDEWRLQIDVQDASQGETLVERLDPGELEHELSDAFHDRVIVSRDGPRIFVYAGSRDQAEKARAFIVKEAEDEGWAIEPELTHWHPAAEAWEDPDLPLPDDDAAKVAEHEQLIAAERQDLAQRGVPEFEVRVDLPSHRDAVRFDELLRAEGVPSVRRWKYLVVGASDEDAARALAKRLEAEAPAGSKVAAEGSWQAVYAERPVNPFAVFGGLGG
jgi:hypothetical protein